MKIKSAVFVVLAVIFAATQGHDHVKQTRKLFSQWKDEYNKLYATNVEEEYRYKVFLDNLELIEQLNTQHKEVEFGINKFADMSPKEFQSKVLMPKRRAPKHDRESYLTGTFHDPLPTTFNWTVKGVVSSVKDQGGAGSCWAFSTIGNIESQWAIKGQKLIDLSVEQVVDCDGGEDIKGGNADCGTFGGWPYLAYQYIQKAGGLETEEDYKYCCGGEKGSCENCPPPGFNTSLCGPPVWFCNMSQSCGAKLDKTKFVPGLKIAAWKAISQNETEIAARLMAIGPLSVALDANMLQFYRRGVFDPFICSTTELNHAVLLVGFGHYKGWIESKDYWLIKNSWGTKWGENGYFRINRGKGTCGINTQVTTAFLENP